MLETNRNPNFLGEMLLYSSFAFLVDTFSAFIILISIWSTIFVSRIVLKEKSLSQKEGWQKYKNNSYLLLHRYFKNDLMNIGIYFFGVWFLIFFYQNGGVESTLKKLSIIKIK